jgi:histidinol dehydrogenase
LESVFPIFELDSSRGKRRLEGWQTRRDRILSASVLRQAAQIVRNIRRDGDRALLEAMEQFEGVQVRDTSALRLDLASRKSLASEVDPAFEQAFERAWERVFQFHLEQKAALKEVRVTGYGYTAEELRVPLGRVGLYLPGGRASYPSTLLMGVGAARAAGVGEIVVVCPYRTLFHDTNLIWALSYLKVAESWGIGGAHGVAALAWGTESIRRVEFLAGPGNAWVTAAKAIVAGHIGIDGWMGPSEVVIVAAGSVLPEWIGADLLAQAEHDPQAGALLVTWDRRLAMRVGEEIRKQLPALPTREVAAKALSRFGGALLVRDLEDALELVRRLAPEHLQLVGDEAEKAADRFGPAGAIFVGMYTPEVFGDYLAGPNHILPTCGAARFQSPVGVETFLRRFHRLEVRNPEVAAGWGREAEVLARAEGLPAHAHAATLRAASAAKETAQ